MSDVDLDAAINRVRAAILHRANLNATGRDIPGDYLRLVGTPLPIIDFIIADILISIPDETRRYLPRAERTLKSLWFDLQFLECLDKIPAAELLHTSLDERFRGTNIRKTQLGDALIPLLVMLPHWEIIVGDVNQALQGFTGSARDIEIACEVVADFINDLPVTTTAGQVLAN